MPDINYTETELISLLQSNEAAAYNYLYDKYSGALYSIIRKIIVQEDKAVDVLQEAFIKIWKNIHTYDPNKAKLFTWMINIAKNISIDILRSKDYKSEQNRTASGDVFIENENLSINVPVDHIGINKILEQLKDDYKKIIDLAYFKGYTQDEISKELNIPIGTVKTKARNAILELRKLLKV